MAPLRRPGVPVEALEVTSACWGRQITAALDPELIGEVVRVLDRLARDGTTMVLVTH